MKKILLFTFIFIHFISAQQKYRDGYDKEDAKIKKQIEIENKKKKEQIEIKNQKKKELRREKLIEAKRKLLKEVDKEEKKRLKKIEEDRNTTQKKEDPRKTYLNNDKITYIKKKKVKIRKMIVRYVNDVVKRLKKDLSKTSKLDLFDINGGSQEQDGEKRISLVNPKPLKGQSQKDFKKMLYLEKNKARKNKIVSMILDISYRDDFEEDFGSFLYEKISQDRYYTKYPQEINFISCFRCIYTNKAVVKKTDSGIVIQKNSLNISEMKSLQRRYDLDMYTKIHVIYEKKNLRFQVQFYSAKTNKLIWSRNYSYYINSLSGKSFAMDMGADFIYNPSNPIELAGDLKLGVKFDRIGKVGFKFQLGGGLNIGEPEFYLFNGFFDWNVSDLFSYGNKVGWILGTDLGIEIGTPHPTFDMTPSPEIQTFFNWEFYTSVHFVESAYVYLGGLLVFQDNPSSVEPAMTFGIGVLIF